MRRLLVTCLVTTLLACSGPGEDEPTPPTDVRPQDMATPQCVFNADCDDGDFCTDDLCVEAVCTSTPKVCDDGLFCNGVEVCDSVAESCIATNVPEVDDAVDCTIDECNEAKDQVTHLPDHSICDDMDLCTDDLCHETDGCGHEFNQAPCDDGKLCTLSDQCLDGECAGTPRNCDDGLFCNGSEACDPSSGNCVTVDEPVLDDQVDCTVDSCDEELDAVTHEPDHDACHDPNPCTDDVCDPLQGCRHENNQAPCDDGLFCTEDDTCFQGLCYGTSKACDDGLFCNGSESCDDDSGNCLPGIAPTLDDGLDCTLDQCDDLLDEVVHLPQDAECEDGDPCTDNVCQPGVGCSAAYNQAPCSDGDPCTVDDLCTAGQCGGVPKACSDGLFCNGEESCDALTGVCLDGVPPLLDDDVACTSDSCDEESDAAIHAEVDAACDDQNPCTDDWCDAEVGCTNEPNTLGCDDGDLCTADDVCADGLCLGQPVVCNDGQFCNGVESCDADSGDCLPGIAPDLDDGVACTTDSCDEEADTVVHELAHADCDDDNPCTDDLCDVLAGCTHTPNALKCDDGLLCTLADACKKGQCVGEPKLCSNGIFCDGLEYCDPLTGECAAGTPPPLDDGIECTTDSCDEEINVIVHAADSNLCDDNNPCTDDACKQGQGCVFTPNTDPCSDGEPCSVGDVCNNSACQPGQWKCEDCTNDLDDNGNGMTDCCDPLCQTKAVCLQELACADGSDNDCDLATDCADIDCLGVAACGPYPQPGDLVITEIMKDPDAVSDAAGEWFEVTNVTDQVFQLRFLTVSDDGANQFVVSESLTAQPGAVLVFARNADLEFNGGVNADYEYSNFQLSNASDAVRLTLNGVVIDEVVYDGGALFPDPTGASLQLDVGQYDGTGNDDGGNWCTSLLALGEAPGSDFGTPGQANLPCHELDCGDETDEDADGNTDCADPDCAALDECGDDDADGIINRDDICPGWDDGIDADQDAAPDGCEIDWAGGVLPAGGAVWDIAQPLELDVSVLMSDVTSLPGAPKGISGQLLFQVSGKNDWKSVPLAYLAEGGEGADLFRGTLPPFSVVPGLAVTVKFELTYITQTLLEYPYDNDTVADANGQPQPLVFVTTGQAPAPGAGDLVITEIMKNPEHIPDGLGEWFELFVAADHVVDLKGVVIKDLGTDSHTVVVSVFGEPGQYLVFGANGNWAENGEINMAYVYEGIALGNTADEVMLYNGTTLIDGVAYDGGATFPNPSGASLSLSLEATDHLANDDGANWCPGQASFGAGDLGSPGGPNPTCE